MNLRALLPLSLSLVACATGCPSEDGATVEPVGSCVDVPTLERAVLIDDEEDLAQLDGIVALRGGLQIRGASVTNLTALIGLRCIGGGLSVDSADSIETLQGLNNLEFVGDSLQISGNDSLRTTRALGNGLVIEGSLIIDDNPALTDVEALAHVVVIGQTLTIRSNPLVTEFPIMADLAEVQALAIEYNPSLVSMSGFGASAVTELLGPVIVTGNAVTSMAGLNNIVAAGGIDISGEEIVDLRALASLERTDFLTVQFTGVTDLTGLAGLEHATDRLWIMDNARLLSLAGLENVRAVDAWMRIERNGQLADVSALLGVGRATGVLSVRLNRRLASCAVDALVAHLVKAGLVGVIDVGANDEDGVCGSSSERVTR